MAERSALRTAKPQDAPGHDPFAELTRIIGFDPRVKVARPARAPAGGAEAAPLPAAPEPVDDWDAEFASTDFGLSAPRDHDHPIPPEPAGEPAAAAAPPVREAARPAGAQHGFPAGQTQAGNLAAAQPDVASFEISGEIDEITEAFEQEWRTRTAWTPSRQSVGIAALPDQQLFDAEDHPEEAEDWDPPQDAAAFRQPDARSMEDDEDLLAADLDDALASSMELDFDDLLADERGMGASAEEVPEILSALVEASRPRQPEEHAARPSDRDMEPDTVEAGEPASFEDELTALLGGDAPVSPALAVPQPARDQPETAGIPAAAPAAARPAGEPSVVVPLERQPPMAPAMTRRVEKPVEPPAARAATVEDDDPFAALAAMAARYRNAQFTPAPKAAPAPPPAAAPAPIEAEAASPQHAPEVEEMKRPSSVRYDTPEIDTVEVPEYPMATADDLDIPSNPYGSADEPQAARSRYDDYDSEFDHLLQDMTAGEPAGRARPASAAPRPPMPSYAPQPRQVSPRPVMPRASTMPEQPRMPQQARAQAAFDTDWDDYAQPAPAGQQGYGYDEVPFDEDFDGEQPAAAARKPARKRGGWFAALFGSAAILVAGGAYALKFTGVAESGGPILVKADAGPLKIRPENPGGAVVQNQDNQVYDRVAGIGNAAVPAQPKLNSSNEEPVSLDEPEEESSDDTLPGLELSGDDMDMDAAGKNEDRVDAAAAVEQQPEKAPISVAPRKVRTMVVKPDGSLAAREDAAPAVQALASNAAAVLDTVKKGSMAVDSDATASIDAAPSSDDAGPAAATDEDAAAAEPAVVKPDGNWSVQIASQPSEAAARSSYADLAKRFPSALGGRTVSIVKAELAGKGTVWRVRVAAEDRGSAASFCTDYKAAGGNCFVTK